MGLVIERLGRHGQDIRTFEPNVESTAPSAGERAEQLERPRAIWLMVPAGAKTEQSIRSLIPILDSDDVVVDDGNSHFRDCIRHAEESRPQGLHLLDVGVSGGAWRPARGTASRWPGTPSPVRRLDPVFRNLAPGPDGVAHVSTSGAGHFVKMVHNGIEYGLIQACAEGFEFLQADPEIRLNLRQIAHLAPSR